MRRFWYGVVASEGLEPPTPALGKRRSVQLSYEATPTLYRHAPPGATAAEGQFACSGGTIGSGSGAIAIPSSTSAFASARVACP